MSTIIQKKEKWYRCHYKILGISLIVILLLLIFGHVVTYNLINNQKEKSENIITQILINASKEKPLIPDIIVVENNNRKNQKIYNDSLKNAIVEYIANKYSKKSDSNQIFNLSPYILNSEIKNEDKIIKHIEFLNSTITKAIEDSKNQIDTEISKINTWISIWIGIIGFLGIFFPLIINIKSLDELKELQNTLLSSRSATDEMVQKVKQQGRILKKLEIKTIDIENIVKTIKLLSKLKDIDDKFLIYNKRPAEFLGRILEELKLELNELNFDENINIIKDFLHQLSYRLYTLSTYSFVKKRIMDEMILISNKVITALDVLDKDTYHDLLDDLHILIKALKDENH